MAKKVAVVEDEAELASLIEYNLTRGGFQVQLLERRGRTLQDLESWQPDLIVLDVMLPGAGWLRSLPAASARPASLRARRSFF